MTYDGMPKKKIEPKSSPKKPLLIVEKNTLGSYDEWFPIKEATPLIVNPKIHVGQLVANEDPTLDKPLSTEAIVESEFYDVPTHK